MRPKILFLMQLPPPVHGASIVNKSIQDSKLINNSFEARYVDISPATDLEDIGKLSPSKLWLTFIIYLQALTAHMKFKPALVYMTLSPHGFALYKDGLLAILLKALGARVVFHMHGKGISEEASKSRLKKAFYRLVFKGANVIHLSESLFYDVEPIRDCTKELMAVPNSVPAAPEVHVQKDKKVVTFVYLSNLVRTKGADILVRAASLIPACQQDKFKIKIVGKSESQNYLDEIMSILDKSPYRNIEIRGPKYGVKKYEELFSSHVFVLPTKFKNECFPLSILEAMSCGLAVISTNEGAISDIVENDVLGVVLEECTPEALAAAMRVFIDSPDKCQLYGQAGREKYLGNYVPDIFEKNIVKSLDSILRKNRKKTKIQIEA